MGWDVTITPGRSAHVGLLQAGYTPDGKDTPLLTVIEEIALDNPCLEGVAGDLRDRKRRAEAAQGKCDREAGNLKATLLGLLEPKG